MKIKFLITIFCVALIAVFFGAFLRFTVMKTEIGDYSASLVVNQMPTSQQPVELFSAGGVVPHHLLAKEIIEDFFKNLSQITRPQTIVILSPDHFDASIVTRSDSFIGPNSGSEGFDDLLVDKKLLEELRYRNILVQGESFVALEHGITVLTPFVKNYFSQVKILPLLAPAKLEKEKVEELVKILNEPEFRNSIIIASVDFSHYLPENIASFHDVKSISVLLGFRHDEFRKIEVDCWQCLYAARLLAESRGQTEPKIIAHKNSIDFWKGEPSEETTSYFSVIFKKPDDGIDDQLMLNDEILNARAVLFLGDIMLGRHIEYLMKKNGHFYPFEKIKLVLKGVDIVFGNLEGAITKKPDHFPAGSLRFNFSPIAAEILSSAGVNLVSLANNHTLDMGKDGLIETKEILKKAGVDFVGDPLKCDKSFFFQKDNLIFLAFNKTYPGVCPEAEIVKTVKTIKSSAPSPPNYFLAVSIHWGEEYKEKSADFQRQLGRQIIDAGADLIIGHHPHTVQEIEIYKNKLIFYSLGNFIFDQYFSVATQQGLAVGAEIYPRRLIYRLFPIKIQLGQPVLMKKKEGEAFLAKLAAKSTLELQGKIKSGIIEVDF